uniref:Uncharacterized protein n=1 Tax=Timema shepardi TaxID=629360 RepID=A0A7R9AP24_TIMSH|nr:unnamed protein product [Timema shepardi]
MLYVARKISVHTDCQLDPKAFLDQYDRNAGRYDAARGDMREDLGQTGNGPRGNQKCQHYILSCSFPYDKF